MCAPRNGDAGDLIRLVAASHADQAATYLYLAGEDRAADVEGELAKRGIKARTRDRLQECHARLSAGTC